MANKCLLFLPTRGWEMLLGGLAYFSRINMNENSLKFLSIFGLVLIVSAYFFISKNNIWPGYLALIPAIGAYLILASDSKLGFFNHYIFQSIGNYSYSIYLWHWVVVYLAYRYTDMGLTIIIFGIFLSYILGRLSYEYVETKGLNTTNKFVILLSFSLVFILYTFFDKLNEYRPIAKTPNNKLVAHYFNKKNSSGPWVDNLCKKEEGCVQGGVFLWGDSHAHALYHGLNSNRLSNLSTVTTRRCAPSLNYPDYVLQYGITCNENNRKAINHIRYKKPSIVILAQRKDHENNNWENIALKLNELGVNQVIVIGPVPQFKGELPVLVAKKYFKETLIKKVDMDESIFITNMRMNEKKSSNYYYVDVLGTLCTKENCLFQSVKENNYTLLTSDYGHLNNEGSLFIFNEFISSYLN
jgi:hypothetical protein